MDQQITALIELNTAFNPWSINRPQHMSRKQNDRHKFRSAISMNTDIQILEKALTVVTMSGVDEVVRVSGSCSASEGNE
jgi:hypothetical protein